MTLQPTHHDPTPSVALLRKKGKVSKRDEQKDQEFVHPDKPSMYALDEAKRVEIGRKYWEQKEDWAPMSSVDWKDLKSAKDFDLGVGNTLYRHGTLSTWTDDQIKVLQKEMENTLALTGDEDDDDDDDDNEVSISKSGTVRMLDKPGHRPSAENASVATVVINNDVSISMSQEAASLLSAQIGANSLSYDNLPYSPSGAGGGGGGGALDNEDSFIDTIGKKNKKKRRNKNGGAPTHSPQGTDLALYDIASEIERQKQAQATLAPGDREEETTQNISKEMAGHRRTRTEALRLKLSDMEKRLKFVQQDLSKANTEIDSKSQDLQVAEQRIERDKQVKEQNNKLQTELSALTGALKSAQAELVEAENQISRRDQENANLQRELSICKQLNQELVGKSDDGNGGGSGLTADDLLNSRIADAKRFAYMLTAMQEQLEFEREVFTKRIHELEIESEKKDVQLTALYQLYNKLVAKTEKKGWFSRWLDKDDDKTKGVDVDKAVESSADV